MKTLVYILLYNLRFPEIFRKLTLEGAKLIFVPAEFPNPKRKTWKTLIRARAIENQVIVVAVNRIGEGQQNSFFGYSMITDGETKEVLSDLPMVRTIEVELSVINKIREKLPTLEDRREDLY
jgi:predicted amidohydrolase